MLTFECGVQMLVLNSYTFFNKLNIVMTILALFAILFYVTSFYPLIFRYQKQNSAKTILNHSFYTYESFMLESFCYLLRNYIRSLIQGTLLLWYSTQLILLCFSNLICIGFCIYFRKLFLSRFAFLFTLLYHIILLTMDTCFLVDYKHP